MPETFFTSVGCMDGRSECTVAKWGREKFGVQYADAITEAGLVGILGKDTPNSTLVESLTKKMLISIEKHRSTYVVVSGHQECAGNPVADEHHKQDILRSVEVIKKLIPQTVTVIPVFVKRGSDNHWIVEELVASAHS